MFFWYQKLVKLLYVIGTKARTKGFMCKRRSHTPLSGYVSSPGISGKTASARY